MSLCDHDLGYLPLSESLDLFGKNSESSCDFGRKTSRPYQALPLKTLKMVFPSCQKISIPWKNTERLLMNFHQARCSSSGAPLPKPIFMEENTKAGTDGETMKTE